jgi:hypothetical protein
MQQLVALGEQMTWPINLSRMPLRALIALAARCVRRVHREGLQDAEQRRFRTEAIGLAESVALGEPLDPGLAETVRRKLDAMTATPADRAAAALARAALGAAEFITRSMENPEEPRRYADEAFRLGRQAATDAAGLKTDQELFEQALEKDVGLLEGGLNRSLRAAEEDWLGTPIEPAEWGPMAQLWPSQGRPSWDRPPPPRVRPLKPGETPVFSDDAQIFCWHVTDKQTANITADAITKVIQEAQAATWGKNDAGLTRQPVFMVYAPNLDDEVVAKLVFAGATVLDDASFAGSSPVDSSDLANRIRDVICDPSAHGQGEWWRHREARYPALASRRADFATEPSKEDERAYAEVHRRSQATEQEGWPIGA